MFKVKVISRNPDDYIRETKFDIHKGRRNYDSSLHKFEAPREYARALNAAKMQKIFAKPFVAALSGHKDCIQCLVKHPEKLSMMLSGSCDGEIRIWNLPTQKCMKTFQAHTGFMRDMCFTNDNCSILTVGEDNNIKTWRILDNIQPLDNIKATNTIIAKTMLTGITHSIAQDIFATSGQRVDIWESTRAEPLKSFQWGSDSIKCVKFNPVEHNLLGSCMNDRSILLHDIREAKPMRKVTMTMCANKISWNPMEAFVFTAASEDENLYTFDLRNLTIAMVVHTGHAAAVLDVDYAPTGKEFVSASYDKTLQIFPVDSRRCRDIYHGRRMQRLSNIIWSLDNKYIACGSDDMNIRVWKSYAWEKLGLVDIREKSAIQYRDKLKEKFAHHPEVKRIINKHHVPAAVYQGEKQKQLIVRKEERKRNNLEVHNNIIKEPIPVRTKSIAKEVE